MFSDHLGTGPAAPQYRAVRSFHAASREPLRIRSPGTKRPQRRTSSALASWHSLLSANTERGSLASWIWFLHVDRQRPAFTAHDWRHLGNEQASPTELTAIEQDNSVRAQFCRLPAEDGFLETIGEKAGLTLDRYLSQRFMRRGCALIAIHLHQFPAGRLAWRRGFGSRDSSAVTAAKGGKRQAGKNQAGGASCARSHATQDAKDFPFSDSPRLTIFETNRIGRQKVDR
jgi:hypothetical protein